MFDLKPGAAVNKGIPRSLSNLVLVIHSFFPAPKSFQMKKVPGRISLVIKGLTGRVMKSLLTALVMESKVDLADLGSVGQAMKSAVYVLKAQGRDDLGDLGQ